MQSGLQRGGGCSGGTGLAGWGVKATTVLRAPRGPQNSSGAHSVWWGAQDWAHRPRGQLLALSAFVGQKVTATLPRQVSPAHPLQTRKLRGRESRPLAKGHIAGKARAQIRRRARGFGAPTALLCSRRPHRPTPAHWGQSNVSWILDAPVTKAHEKGHFCCFFPGSAPAEETQCGTQSSTPSKLDLGGDRTLWTSPSHPLKDEGTNVRLPEAGRWSNHRTGS